VRSADKVDKVLMVYLDLKEQWALMVLQALQVLQVKLDQLVPLDLRELLDPEEVWEK